MRGEATSLYPVSPVTLNAIWPKVSRLLAAVILSTLGCLLNGFFVASFFVEDSLRKSANVYVCCLGLCDLLVAGLVVPATALVLLSGEGDNTTVCHFQYLIVSACTYAYSLYFLLVAIGNYLRVCRNRSSYEAFVHAPVSIISFMIAIVSIFFSVVGIYGALDYDFCERQHKGNMIFRIVTGTTFFIIPGLLTIYSLLATYCYVRKREHNYRRTFVYKHDKVEAKTNIFGYLLFLACWIPYAIIVYLYPDISSVRFYSWAWTVVLRSIFSSTLYSLPFHGFRKAYAYLFNYCCCKSTLRVSRSYERHRRALERSVPAERVRTHIIGAAFVNRPPVITARPVQEL